MRTRTPTTLAAGRATPARSQKAIRPGRSAPRRGRRRGRRRKARRLGWIRELLTIGQYERTILLTDGQHLLTVGRLDLVPMSPTAPAYRRLGVDERRRRLLDLGAELFTRHAYDELSMAGIARESGISKALLYHYFPSKEAFFRATLSETAADVLARTTPDPSLPALARLEASLDAYLSWIEEHTESYRKLIDS